jgi:hypothetical protein
MMWDNPSRVFYEPINEVDGRRKTKWEAEVPNPASPDFGRDRVLSCPSGVVQKAGEEGYPAFETT